MIVKDLVSQKGHSCLILASRLEQLRNIRDLLPDELRSISAMIDGSMTSKKGKAERETAIEDMRIGRKKILFASFGLAKEGLAVPGISAERLRSSYTVYWSDCQKGRRKDRCRVL